MTAFYIVYVACLQSQRIPTPLLKDVVVVSFLHLLECPKLHLFHLVPEQKQTHQTPPKQIKVVVTLRETATTATPEKSADAQTSQIEERGSAAGRIWYPIQTAGWYGERDSMIQWVDKIEHCRCSIHTSNPQYMNVSIGGVVPRSKIFTNRSSAGKASRFGIQRLPKRHVDGDTCRQDLSFINSSFGRRRSLSSQARGGSLVLSHVSGES